MITFKFSYDRDPETNKPLRTTCKVFVPKADKEFVGTASCHPSDNFNKRVGRKLAVTRSLSTVPRPIRKLIWKSYETQFGFA